MLCGFDAKYCNANQRDARTTSTGRNSVAAYRGYGPQHGQNTGVGYDNSGYDDYGFGGMFGMNTTHGSESRDRGKAKAEGVEKQTDQSYTWMFAFLKILLPCPDRKPENTSFDIAPVGALLSILMNSKILEKAAELLRNDSLDNATKRKDLYMALIGFVQVVGTHDATKTKAMYGDRIVWPDKVNLLVLSFAGPGNSRSETGSSLASGLRNLNIQSEVREFRCTKYLRGMH